MKIGGKKRESIQKYKTENEKFPSYSRDPSNFVSTQSQLDIHHYLYLRIASFSPLHHALFPKLGALTSFGYHFQPKTLEKPSKLTNSFATDIKSPRKGKTYSQNSHPKGSVKVGNTIEAPEACDIEDTHKTTTEVWSHVIEEKIRANLEPRNAQFLSLSQLLKQLIQDNSAKITP